MIDKKCGGCVYFEEREPAAGLWGVCRRYPPTRDPYPLHEFDWCGEFNPKEDNS